MRGRQVSLTAQLIVWPFFLSFFFFSLDYRLDNENYFTQKMHLMELKMGSQYKFTPTSEQIPQALYGK